MKKETVQGVAMFIFLIGTLKVVYEGYLSINLPYLPIETWMSWIGFIDLLNYAILLLLLIVIFQLNTLKRGDK